MEDQTDVTPVRNAMRAVSRLWTSLTNPGPIGKIHCSEDSEVYPMNYGKIGICYIFNHKKFKSKMKLDDRSGTDVDAKLLKLLFTNLHFDVVTFDDYEDDRILFELQEVSGKKYKHYSCFVCCILTYGTDDGELCASNGKYPIHRIYDRFYADLCTFMAGKPKIFFIQACPCSMKKSVNQSTDYGKSVPFKIPTNADFLVAYSTVPGHYSWENSNNGSWFIDALCSTVTEYATDMDLFQLLSIVNYKVSVKCNNAKLKVEVPCITSTLTRDIKLPVQQPESKLLQGDGDFADGMGSYPKIGKVIIFNHKNYDNDPKLEKLRKGTERDAANLEKIFKELNFDVEVFTDKKKDFILKMLKTVADGPHEKYNYFICCILTHGDYGYLDAKDGPYEIDNIFSLFYDKWIGKPKIYFIQACQGTKVNPGIKMVKSRKQSTDSEGTFKFRHLSHPDFLIVSSTAPGYFSFRNETEGSWFVQELFKAFTKHAEDKEFLQILTITNRQVAIERLSYCPDEKEKHKKKQTLCLTSTLTQNIDFKYLKQNN